MAVPDAMFTVAIVAFYAGMGMVKLWPSLTPAELVAVGNAWTAKMRVIVGSNMRSIICFTMIPQLVELTLTHLIILSVATCDTESYMGSL